MTKGYENVPFTLMQQYMTSREGYNKITAITDQTKSHAYKEKQEKSTTDRLKIIQSPAKLLNIF